MGGGVEPETPSGSSSSGSTPVGGKPPRHHLASFRHCGRFAAASEEFELDSVTLSLISPTDIRPGFLPVFRSRSCTDIGPKPYMEDEHLCVDNLIEHLVVCGPGIPAPGAFYGVFDGHGGTDAACFVRKNFLKYITEDCHFPNSMEMAIRSAFVKADHAIADSHFLDRNSGTTALTVLIFGRLSVVKLHACGEYWAVIRGSAPVQNFGRVWTPGRGSSGPAACRLLVIGCSTDVVGQAPHMHEVAASQAPGK